ncbi:hypothetical protein BLOT_003033 [Blomia tropicalis]|nr:hypothetical protein BLOT_003033 [Blomia tropicalis]
MCANENGERVPNDVSKSLKSLNQHCSRTMYQFEDRQLVDGLKESGMVNRSDGNRCSKWTNAFWLRLFPNEAEKLRKSPKKKNWIHNSLSPLGRGWGISEMLTTDSSTMVSFAKSLFTSKGTNQNGSEKDLSDYIVDKLN